MKRSHVINEIWVYGDFRDTALFNNSLNLLAGAEDLAGKRGGSVVLVMPAETTGSIGEGRVPQEKGIEKAFSHGADRVLILDDRGCCQGYPHLIARAVARAVTEKKPALVLFPLTDIVREIAARAAFACGSGLIADCVALKAGADDITALSPYSDGRIMAELGFSDAAKTGFITVQPNAFQKRSLQKPTGNIEIFSVEPPKQPLSLRRISQEKEIPSGKSLETADKVVVGGAGVGNIEGFRRVRILASALDAAIGATRPPVLWHWTDDESLIGQTGKTVKPKLLISLGTSGAVQYTAGIKQAKTIVAVNRDPAAPIFNIADIGIVADINRFLPLFTDAVKKNAMRSLADAMENQTVSGSGSDFGSKLLKMRESHDFTLETLAEKALCTPEFIEDLENNKTTPSVGFLIKLSEVFDIDPGTFLNEDERSKLSGSRAKAYTKRTGNYYYQSLTPGAENEHLRVFMVTIESNKKHKPVAFRHEGEEYIYVMEGKIELTLGEKTHKLMTGECMKFNSETPHQLKSLGNEMSKCLVALYTP